MRGASEIYVICGKLSNPINLINSTGPLNPTKVNS